MAPSFDCFSSLLCTEDSTIIFDDEHSGGFIEEDTWQPPRQRRQNPSSSSTSIIPDVLPLQQSEECFQLMIEKESEQWHGGVDYLNKIHFGHLDSDARKESIDWIQKVGAHFGFGPVCSYLSINYLDRFLAAYELPKGRAWTMQLLGVACLSLAAKMEETDVPLTLDLQVCESRFIFEAKTIQRMELLVLSTLNWRMQAITPFSFIDYFLSKINDDQSSIRSSISQSTQLILSTLRGGIDFLEFKPSEIAAAVAICVLGETNAQTIDSCKILSILIQFVEKEKLLKCVELIHELALNNASSKDTRRVSTVPCVPQSPMGVLDALCFSYKSDDTNAGASCSSSPNSPDAKRRRLL